LWSITKGKEITHDEQAEVSVIEDKVDNANSTEIEALVLHRARQDELQHFPALASLIDSLKMTDKCNVIIAERKPRKYQVKHLIDKLNMDPRLTCKRMRGTVYVGELDGRMDGSEERSIKPATALGDEFRHLVRYIGHCIGGLDIMEDPLAAPFRDEFPAQDLGGILEGHIGISNGGRGTYPILGEVHVRGENVRPSTVLQRNNINPSCPL